MPSFPTKEVCTKLGTVQHGPYAEWTRKIGGKTITRRLTPAELAEYQPLFDNAKKLRALLTELQDLTMQITGEGSTQEQ